MPEVRLITPITRQSTKKMQVAAYCRVSSNSADQLNSYAAQIRAYEKCIGARDDWELVDIFADEGLTGMKSETRDEFQRMIRMCELKHIDLIITKSISRFARNTKDALAYVRKLKLLGVGVQFEKEGISTLSMGDEMLLNTFSALAQEESQSISMNQRLSIVKRMELGEYVDSNAPYGYRLVDKMLSNERYCGDVILQKSVTVDCIEKKRKKNTGEAPMYYVQNNHPAIIDRVTFNKVQEELARRKTKTPGSAKSSITSTGKYSRYALTDVLICGNCGTRYRRVTWSRNGVKRIVWRCISRLDYGKKYCSDSPTIMEDKLQEAIVRAVNKFNEQDNATYKALMRATISEALGLNGDPEEVDMLERKVEALNNKMLALVNESVSSGDGIEAHESEFMTLSQEAELLKQRIAAIQESTAKDNGEQNRLEQIQAIIAERESKCMEYDDSIVRQMVECIKVYPGGKLEIIFGGGYLVEESV